MITNFYPIKSSITEFSLLCQPYTEEKLKRLRQDYNSTHSFFRVTTKSLSELAITSNDLQNLLADRRAA